MNQPTPDGTSGSSVFADDTGAISRRTWMGALVAGAVGVAGAGVVTGCSGAPSAASASSTRTRVTSSGSSASTSPSPSPMGSSPALRSGPDISHGSRTGSQVALTFHGAGDPALVTNLLADLLTARARVTVLAIGQWLASEPRLARLIGDAGHELGNHTWSHQAMARLSAPAATVEINRAATELHRLTGSIGTWFRPSGTPHSTATIRTAASKAGYGRCLAYDLDPLDYTDPGPSAIVRRVAARVRPGSIVSLHLGHPQTIAAMPGILRALQQRGLTAVTASELLGSG